MLPGAPCPRLLPSIPCSTFAGTNFERNHINFALMKSCWISKMELLIQGAAEQGPSAVTPLYLQQPPGPFTVSVPKPL